MDTKLIAGAALLLLAMPLGLANTYHRDSLGTTGTATSTAAACDDVAGSVIPAVLCGTGGIGAIIDVTDLNPAFKASGSCTVTQDSSLVSQTNGDFAFTCGVDRDDDGVVTNADASSSDALGFDDDYGSGSASGPYGSASVAVCFRADLDGSFDDVDAFIAGNVPSTGGTSGTFDVDLTLTSDTSCSPSRGGADPFVGVTTGVALAGLCSQTYDHGKLTTEACPPDLCGLDQGFADVRATGSPGGPAPVGTLECHDASHQVTGTMSTASGSFDGNGEWRDLTFGPIVGGTHPHCYLSSIGDADFATVQCGKV